MGMLPAVANMNGLGCVGDSTCSCTPRDIASGLFLSDGTPLINASNDMYAPGDIPAFFPTGDLSGARTLPNGTQLVNPYPTLRPMPVDQAYGDSALCRFTQYVADNPLMSLGIAAAAIYVLKSGRR